MSEQVRYFRLGLFVLIALAILLAAVAALGGSEWFRKGIEVETYINESVQGLDVGSPVKYRGVQVGKVTEIDFVLGQYTIPREMRSRYAGQVLIRMEIMSSQLLPQDGDDQRVASRFQRLVDAGIRVRVASMSIAGPSYLEIDYLAGRAPPPLEIIWEPQSPYLPSAPSTGTQVVSAVERLASQLEQVRIDTLVADIHQLVVNIDTAIQQADIPAVSKEAVGLVSELRQTNAHLQAVLGDVKTFVGNAESLVGEAHALVSDPNAKKTLAESAELAVSLRKSADHLDELLTAPQVRQILDGLASAAQQAGPAAEDVRLLVGTLHRLVQTTERDLSTITDMLQHVATNLDNFAQEARDNPARLLFSQPPPKTPPGKDRK